MINFIFVQNIIYLVMEYILNEHKLYINIKKVYINKILYIKNFK
jgi:hypothetical protein